MFRLTKIIRRDFIQKQLSNYFLGVLRGIIPINKCRRILVIRPDDIGDVVLFSPFIRELRKSTPQALIYVVTNEHCKSLLLNCPYIDGVFSLPFKTCLETDYIRELKLHAESLKHEHLKCDFDVLLLPRGDMDCYGAEAIAATLGGAAKIYVNEASFIRRKTKQKKRSEFADFVARVKHPQSEIESNLSFLKRLGGRVSSNKLEFWCSQADFSFVDQWLQESEIGHKFLVFHPLGSRSLLRRWPKGRCRELVEKLLARTEFSIVAIGGPLDDFVREEFNGLTDSRFRFAMNVFTLPQIGALIQRSGFFVGGDSGPMHIANAVGARTIGIFGPGSRLRFGPRSERSEVISLNMHCSPDELGTFEAACGSCVHETNLCLSRLDVDRVISRIEEIFV